MADTTLKRIALLFRMLTHPARLAVLECLRDGERSLGEVAGHVGYTASFVERQLRALCEIGVVSEWLDGWTLMYRVTCPEVFMLVDQARTVVAAKDRSHQPRPGAI